MAINTQTIRIDLNTGRTIPVAFAHQNDTNRQLTFQLYNNGVAFTPSSTTVKFAYKSPIVNGRYSVITGSQMASGTVSGNTVTVTLPAQYTQVSGVGLLTMILTTSGNTLRPVNIKFVCQGSADGDDQILNASDWPEGLYDYMDNWLAENEPTEIANLKSDLIAIATPTMTVGKYISSVEATYGDELSDANSAITSLMPVVPLSKVRVINAWLYNNRSIAGYDKNQKFKTIIATNENPSSPIDITIPDDVYYIKVTASKNYTVSARYLGIIQPIDKQDREDLDGLYLEHEITVKPLTAGYIASNGSTINTSSYMFHSDYIPVTGGTSITINKLINALGNTVFAYDKHKRFVAVGRQEGDTGEIENYAYDIPYNVAFIRINSYKKFAKITYAEKYKSDAKELGLVNILDNGLNGYMSHIFEEAMAYPAITIIDDDTWSQSAIEDFHDFCEDNDIKGSFACLTSRWESYPNMKDTLLQYEAEGYSVNVHGYVQDEFYNLPPSRNIAQARADLIHGMRDMQAAGFQNYKHWCTPYGVTDYQIKNLARYVGMECIIASAYQGGGMEYIEAMSPSSKWQISRNTFSESLVSALQTSVGIIVPRNGWILLETHFSKADNQTTAFRTALSDFITYAKNAGCQFVTLNEEWKRRKPVYDFFEMF